MATKKDRILHKLSVSTIPNALNRSARDGRTDRLIFVSNHDVQAVQKYNKWTTIRERQGQKNTAFTRGEMSLRLLKLAKEPKSRQSTL